MWSGGSHKSAIYIDIRFTISIRYSLLLSNSLCIFELDKIELLCLEIFKCRIPENLYHFITIETCRIYTKKWFVDPRSSVGNKSYGNV